MCEVSETFFVSLAKPKPAASCRMEKEKIIAGHPVLNYSFVDKLWSFEIAGGKDQHAPLTVINVKRNGLGKRSGIKVGDEIVSINNISTENMTLQEAQLEIQEAGRSLKIIVRGWESSFGRREMLNCQFEFAATPTKAATAARTRRPSTFGSNQVSFSLMNMNESKQQFIFVFE